MSHSTNRHPIQKFFVTFPKSGELTKTEFLKCCKELHLTYYIVCKETHEDGSPHLHALLWFHSKKTKSRLLKFFKEKYPNDNKRIHVESVRNFKATIEYCKKEDSQYLESPGGPPKRPYKYPAWMVSACKQHFKQHPADMASEYRAETLRLENRKREIDKILLKILLDFPNSASQCHILESERNDIVHSLLMRAGGL